MRILFLNTTDTVGGAAVVMQRLMKKLKEYYGTENRLLVKTKKGDSPDTRKILLNESKIIAEKIIDRVTRPLGLLYQSFPFSSRSILSAIRSYKPDIINLHNTHGAYLATPLISQIAQIAPIVWTLHDMWSFTANASHTFGNISWKNLKNDKVLKKIPPSIGINTGRFLLRQKRNIYKKSNLTIVTPSLWLKELAEQSPVFEGKNIHHIYNGVDTTVFYPQEKQAAKKKLGFSPDQPVIVFSSHFVYKNNPWKGGRDLVEILSRINQYTNETINFLVLGEGRFDELNSFSNFKVTFKGYIHDEKSMAECLSAADLFIYPTRADNLPNVLVESIACGIPCITFDVGGNSEIIKHNFNGIIVPPFDLERFAIDTLTLLNDREKLSEYSSNSLLTTKKCFQLDDMVSSYYFLFEKIIASGK
jgi:glycosyltransferase involved in cell wall biosynthesis